MEAPKPPPPAVHVLRDGQPIAIHSVLAKVDAFDEIAIVFSTTPATCADAAGITFQLGPQLHHDGTLGWAMRGYGDGAESASSTGAELAGAIVEPKPGGRVHFHLGEAGTPLALDEHLSIDGDVETVVCPTAAAAAPPEGTGFVEIAGRRYPVGAAVLTGAKPKAGARKVPATLAVSVLGPAFTCETAYMAGSELALVFEIAAGGKLVSARLDGARIEAHPQAAGKAFAFTPKLTALAAAPLEISGSETFDANGAAYPVTAGGKVTVLDCRKN